MPYVLASGTIELSLRLQSSIHVPIFSVAMSSKRDMNDGNTAAVTAAAAAAAAAVVSIAVRE